ncbi:hypothetical protein M378DRAFT_38380, partial [Amanita muscaria Koide BX008]
TYMNLSPPKKVWLGDRRYILAVGMGQLHLEMDLGNDQKGLLIVHNAYHVPDLSGNVVSVTYFTKNGYSAYFEQAGCQIFNHAGRLCGLACEDEDLHVLAAMTIVPEASAFRR